jgi:anti-sigma B factor antagonist
MPTPRALSVTVRSHESGVVVYVEGELDMATTRILTDRTDAIAVDPGGTVTLDLAGVGFCDTVGITVLVRLQQRCSNAGWAFRIVNTQPAVRRTLAEFSGLGAYLDLS